MDGVEHDHPLLDLGQGRADGRVGVGVGYVVKRGAHDALGTIDQEAQQLEQHGAGRVKRQRHGQLTHVIDVKTAFDLLDLRRLEVQALATHLAFQLNHGLAVVDVRAIHQRAQCARGGGRDATDHMHDADGVGPAPRYKRKLDDPLQLFARRVVFIPVAVDRQHLAGRFVDGDDVGRWPVGVVLNVEEGVNLVDRAQAVGVKRVVLAAFDLVVGNGRLRRVEVRRGDHDVHVAVHARLDALVVV